MILTKTTSVIETENIGDVSNFKINASGKAFKLLSSGLYSRKIAACIRELSCNAVDAHIAAGKPTEPISVHLPTSTEPWFAVKDTGIGLSDEDTRNLYTTYFSSTKAESNDFIGAMGLGSKSPFTYTDSFNITSTFNGRVTQYTAFVDEEFLPQIAVMSSDVTDAPNGLEIRFAVHSKDFYEFKDEATSIFEHFPVRPKLNLGLVYDNREVGFTSTTGAKLYSESYGKHIAVMGGVGYPINMESIINDNDLNDSIFRKQYHFATTHYFDIGDVDFTPSRESLSYDKRTITKVRDSFYALFNEYRVSLIKDIAETASYWDACALYIKRKRDIGIFGPSDAIVHAATGKAVTEALSLDSVANPHDVVAFTYDNKHDILKRISPNDFRSTPLVQYSHIPEDYLILVNDLPSTQSYQTRMRAKVAARQSSCSIVRVLTATDIEIDAIQQAIPDVEFVRISTLPEYKAVRSKTARTKKAETLLETIAGDKISLADLEQNDSIYYVTRKYTKIDVPSVIGHIPSYTLSRMVCYLADLGIIKDRDNVVYISSQRTEKIKDNPKWKSVVSEFSDVIQNDPSYVFGFAQQTIASHLGRYSQVGAYVRSITTRGIVTTNPTILRLIELYDNRMVTLKYHSNLNQIVNAMGLKIDVGTESAAIQNEISELMTKFPLLFVDCCGTLDPAVADHITTYIELFN